MCRIAIAATLTCCHAGTKRAMFSLQSKKMWVAGKGSIIGPQMMRSPLSSQTPNTISAGSEAQSAAAPARGYKAESSVTPVTNH